MASIQVLDATGATQTVAYPDAGRSAAAASSPVALSTEDKASLDAIGTKLDTLQATVSGTDSQLPAALDGGRLAVALPAGFATQATLANIDADIGLTSDAAASTDTGTFSLIALVKRALQNWTTLLGRVPALVSGRIPVVVDAAAATAALQTTGNTSLTSLDTKLPAQALPGMMPVDTLASVGVARLIAMGATSANVALTTTTRRVSIHATVAGFYAVGTGAQTASATSHYIGAGERLDFDVAANTQIATIRATADGTLYISELTAQ